MIKGILQNVFLPLPLNYCYFFLGPFQKYCHMIIIVRGKNNDYIFSIVVPQGQIYSETCAKLRISKIMKCKQTAN